MKKRSLYMIAAVVVAIMQNVPVRAATVPVGAPYVVIAALQTGQPAAAGNDFVELRNVSEDLVNVTGWRLQYRSAAGAGPDGWTTKRVISCETVAAGCEVVLQPQDKLFLSTYTLAGVASQPISGGFSDVGGQVRLAHDAPDPADPAANVIAVEDMLGYGTAAEAEGGQAAVAPSPGQSLIRKSGVGEMLMDTDSNAEDFMVDCYDPPVIVACPEPPAPEEDEQPAPPASNTNATDPPTAGAGEVAGGASPQVHLPLQITELLPDPASPKQDSTDEFIELFNPNAEPVELAGYRIETGNDFRYGFTLAGDTLAPGGYALVTSAESRLPLTNSGTNVRLLTPAGETVSEVSYGQAKAGEAWAKSADSSWQWTTQPTPGVANVFVAALPKAVAAATTAAKASTSIKKAAAAKTTKAASPAAKTAKTNNQNTEPGADAEATQGNNLAYALLIPIGLLALGYVAYEYRQDIARASQRAWRFVTRQKRSGDGPTPQTD